MQFLNSFHFFFLLLQTYSCKNNTMLHSFLVGEGARTWAKSKGIALPSTIAEADKVNIFYFFTYNFVTSHPTPNENREHISS